MCSVGIETSGPGIFNNLKEKTALFDGSDNITFVPRDLLIDGVPNVIGLELGGDHSPVRELSPQPLTVWNATQQDYPGDACIEQLVRCRPPVHLKR